MIPLRAAVAAAALAAVVAAPASAAAESRRDGPPLRVAGLVGLDTDAWSGLALRLDGELDLQRVAPALELGGIGSLGYSRLSGDFRDYDQTVNLFTIVPAIRLRLDVNRATGFYGDLGFGLYLADVTTRFHAGGSDSTSDVGFMARLGAGWFVWASDAVRFQVEAALSPHFGSYDHTSFQLLVGAALPVR